MKNYMRRLPVRARRNPSDCPVPIEQLPPSLIIVPMTQAALGTLASFLRDSRLAASTKDEVPRFSAEETRELLGDDPERMSTLLLDPKAVITAATKGYRYKNENSETEVLTEVTEPRAKQKFYALLGLPSRAAPPVYIAPVGDNETVYKLVNRRADRDVFALGRLPVIINRLLVQALTSPPTSWGAAVVLPQDIPIKPPKDAPPGTKDYVYETEKFRAHSFLGVVRAGTTENERKLRQAADAIGRRFYGALPPEEQSRKKEDILYRCVYRVEIVGEDAQETYMSPDIASLGMADFLPGEFVSKFIDVAVATYLIKDELERARDASKGKGLRREAVQVKVHEFRHKNKLYTLPALQNFVGDASKTSQLSADDRQELLTRISQARKMLTLRGLGALQSDEELGSPRKQVNTLIGRMPSYFVPNAFSAGSGTLAAQRSNVVGVLYSIEWDAPNARSLLPELSVPVMFTAQGATIAEVARELNRKQLELEAERDSVIRAVGEKEFDKWSRGSEIAPLTIYAMVLTANTGLWPKPASGDLGRGAELASVGGAEKNGKIVLLKHVSITDAVAGQEPVVLVQPAALSERDVNLIFANYVPFSVKETAPGTFALTEGKDAPALDPAVLAENTRVKSIIDSMKRREKEKEQEKAAKKRQARKNAGASLLDMGEGSALVEALGARQPKAQQPRGPADTGESRKDEPTPEELAIAIAIYLHEMAPAEEPYRKPPEEIRRRQVGAKYSSATQLGAERGSEPGTFVPKRKLNKDEVASRLRRQSVGWWANLTRIVHDNKALPIVFTQANNEEAQRRMVDDALELYGVNPMDDSPAARFAALNELRTRVLLDAPSPENERDAYRPARMVRRDSDAEGAPSETLIAQLNPRRASRPPRRPRPPRRGARLNPEPSQAYRAKITAGFTRESDFEPEGSGEIDYTETRRAFPDMYSGKGDLKPELAAERIAQHGQYVRFGRRPRLDDYDFSAPPPDTQAGLSVEEARAVHKRQVEAYDRRRSSSIPASSALCAVNRRQKLKGYRPPSALMRFGESGFADKKIVIWVSPASAAETRVMMYRRNTHIDCDFVASMGGMSLGQLLALALQDVLLWLAQRDTRKLDTYVYVGRVGEGKMRLAWKPGNPLTYSAMLQNLGGNAKTLSDYDAADDTARYRRAAEVSYVATADRAAAEQAEAAEQREQEEAAAEVDLPPAEEPPAPSRPVSRPEGERKTRTARPAKPPVTGATGRPATVSSSATGSDEIPD